jgi:hypothetical protein
MMLDAMEGLRRISGSHDAFGSFMRLLRMALTVRLEPVAYRVVAIKA